MAFQHPDVSILPKHSLIIGDRRIEKGGGIGHEHRYPANGRVTRELTLGSASDVDEAVRAAQRALPAWQALPGDKRRDLMFKFAALCEQNTDELALLSTIEMARSGLPRRMRYWMRLRSFDTAEDGPTRSKATPFLHGAVRLMTMWSMNPTESWVRSSLGTARFTLQPW
jgi:hypothetical protein